MSHGEQGGSPTRCATGVVTVSKTFNQADVAKMLRLSAACARALMACGELRGFRRGRLIRTIETSVNRLLGHEETRPTSSPQPGAREEVATTVV